LPNEIAVQKKPILDKEFQVQGECQIFCPRCKRPIKGYLEVSVRLVSKGQVVPQPKGVISATVDAAIDVTRREAK
jgi:hypothetical protein